MPLINKNEVLAPETLDIDGDSLPLLRISELVNVDDLDNVWVSELREVPDTLRLKQFTRDVAHLQLGDVLICK